VREVLNDGCFNPDSEEARATGKVLALKLSLYYGTGLYACFVDGKNSFTLQRPFTLIEFADLETADDLKGVLFFSLFHLITQRFESEALAGIWKTLVTDELWRFMRHKATADIFEKIIRTYRNIDASAMFASQRVEDYDSEIGRIICDIADTTISLKPGPGELPKLKKIFNLTEAEEEAFQYVDKHQGWSSALLRLERGEGGIVRIIPDPLVDLLLSQSAEQVARRASLRAQYGRLSPALPEAAYAS
jgi:type IV secretory pathway VirB4 component